MTIDSQIQAIQALGYNQQEAHFLRLVALHSGYFVRRQFVRATDSRRGKRDQDFIDRLVARGHAVRETFREDRHLFRIQSKVVYEALGEEDNRNRREHQPSTVRARLMGLDFILEHPHHHYLATQQEKLSYFLEERGIGDETMLPARCFRSNGTLTTRYFPDGFPQFVDEGDSRIISFVYIDDTQFSIDAFRSYFSKYQPLFQALGTLNLVFVTISEDRFAVGQRAFRRFWNRTRENAERAVDLSRVLAHFPHRLLYEQGQTRVLNGPQMRALNEDIHTLCGPYFDQLYEVWKLAGDDGLRAEYAAEQEASKPPRINFTSYVLEYDYDLFGTLNAAS